jgi:DNA-binding response OmpR family regulator
MAEKPLILVADDEEDVRDLVCFNLEQAGFRTVEAVNGLEAVELARQRMPAAVVLDVMMPGRDGFRVCEALRSDDATSRIPVLMLTARGQTQDRIAGLQKGADDYVSKPFSPKELVLRVQALLRRAAPEPGTQSKLTIGPFEFDLAAVKLTVAGEAMALTLLEFKLLHVLASKSGEVIERDTILREVWGYSDQARTRTLDTHIKRLREKLGIHADWLQTARGYGYLFRQPQSRT